MSLKLMITGASGVLGTALVGQLQRWDRCTLLTPTHRELDLLNAEAVTEYFRAHKPNALIHLAALVFGLKGNLSNQLLALHVNTLMTANVLSAVVTAPIEYVFYAGTVASYPFPYPSLPLVESMLFNGVPHHGEYGYGMAKRHSYAYLRLLSTELGIKNCMGVFTNLYGPNDRFNLETGHVVPSLVAKVHEAKRLGLPLDVWGDGSATRDFLHVSDAARAIMLCIEAKYEGILNISSGRAVSIRCVAEILARAANVPQLAFSHGQPVGIPARVVDNTKLHGLGFREEIDLAEGLAMTYRWYHDNYSSARG
jgi:GDP-L-fucose synthase